MSILVSHGFHCINTAGIVDTSKTIDRGKGLDWAGRLSRLLHLPFRSNLLRRPCLLAIALRGPWTGRSKGPPFRARCNQSRGRRWEVARWRRSPAVACQRCIAVLRYAVPTPTPLLSASNAPGLIPASSIRYRFGIWCQQSFVCKQDINIPIPDTFPSLGRIRELLKLGPPELNLTLMQASSYDQQCQYCLQPCVVPMIPAATLFSTVREQEACSMQRSPGFGAKDD